MTAVLRTPSLGRGAAGRRAAALAFVSSLAAALGPAMTACGGKAKPAATATVFDPSGAAASATPVDVTSNPQIEHRYPALDQPSAGGEAWVGVSILGDGVRFSRPEHWSIRDASLEPGHSFVRYVSPKAYSFAVYERLDAPGASWRDIEEHYEADVTANGAKAIGQRVPMATASNQGRAYTIDRKIESKEPILSRSREVLLRGDHHVVLVQIVTSDENLSRLSDELLEVLRRIEVL